MATRSKESHKAKYEFVISKSDSNLTLDEVNDWVNKMAKGKWSKHNRRNTVVYTFHNLDDAFKFKMRWTFS